MMKSLRILGLAAVALALGAPGVRADTVVLKADIPFDFVVADRQLPSGAYSFVQDSDYPGVVQVYARGKHQAIALCQPVAAGETGKVELVFRRHGDQRFLKMIRRAGGSGFSFPKTHAETVAEADGQAAPVGM